MADDTEAAVRAKAEAITSKVKIDVLDSVRSEAFGGEGDVYLEQTAWLIVHHPKKRAAYFADPEKSLNDALNQRKLLFLRKDALKDAPKDAKKIRKLALLIELLINEDPRLVSAKETFYERESFLKEGVQDPQKTFGAVAWMSKGTFAIGAVLVLVGVALAAYVVFFAEGAEEQATLGSLGAFFGGGGVVTTLLAVFKASTKELRTITSDMAKIHMVLTGYGAQITALRASQESKEEPQEAVKRNEEYREITKHAVLLLDSKTAVAAADGKVETAEADAKDRAVESLDQGSSKADGGKDQKPSKIDADEEDKNNKKT